MSSALASALLILVGSIGGSMRIRDVTVRVAAAPALALRFLSDPTRCADNGFVPTLA